MNFRTLIASHDLLRHRNSRINVSASATGRDHHSHCQLPIADCRFTCSSNRLLKLAIGNWKLEIVPLACCDTLSRMPTAASVGTRDDPPYEINGSGIPFVGTARGLETRLVPQAGFELSLIESAGLKNVSLGARVKGIAVLPKSFVSARKLMRQFQPDVVVGAGGYVSGPVVLTAALTNRPTLVMESNALPGWTNRVLARFVDRAAVSFEQALPYFRGKAKVTGNPVRREFFEIPPKQREPGKFSLLVFGGSQGARAINEAMMVALPKLKQLPV
jgi:hypothetical protein